VIVGNKIGRGVAGQQANQGTVAQGTVAARAT
jgi:hypothetical protein